MRPGLMPVTVLASLFGVAISASAFDLRSPDVSDGGTLADAQVYSGFGCNGGNVSPALSWSGAPVGTRSFAFTVYDPDAPSGNGWWHWVVYNLAPTTTSLPRGAGRIAELPPNAFQARNDFGTRDFGGASAALVGYMINANQIGKASITARYGR
jgi:phosphatidylethanolamine-binding protein (PEBP) family uncharacterized protein